MSSLYSAVAAIDMTAVGPSRTTNWSEWVGGDNEIKCGHCKSDVLATDHFCHRCGRGVKPLPCIHHVPSDGGIMPPKEVPVEPVLIVEKDDLGWQVMRVECPECHRKSSSQPRSYMCIAEWNEMPPYAEEPCCPGSRGNLKTDAVGTCGCKVTTSTIQA